MLMWSRSPLLDSSFPTHVEREELRSTKIYEGERERVKPSQELGDRVGAENGRGVPEGDAVDIRKNVLVGDDGHDFLETISIKMAVETMPLQVLNVGISVEDFGQNTFLNLISIFGDLLDELKLFLVDLCHAGLVGCFRCLRHD